MNELSSATRRLIEQGIVVDMTAPGSPYGVMTPDAQTTDEWYQSYEKAGCTFISCTVAADHVANTTESCITEIAKSRNWFLSHPDRFLLVETAEDISTAKQSGKLGVCLNFQGSLQYQRNLQLVEIYKRLGVHHALLTYNNKNLVGDGCHERTDAGLSTFGLTLIAEMNRVGVLVDVTHAGHRTAMEAIDTSKAPVIMSHSLPRAVFNHERNVPDDQMIAAAKKGGVVGMNGLGIFMSTDGGDISPERLFVFLDYSVQLIGAKHVGFGLDYIMHLANALKGVVATTGTSYKQGAGYHNLAQLFAAPSIIAEVVEIMLRKNYAEADVRDILGGNWLRVFRQVCG